MRIGGLLGLLFVAVMGVFVLPALTDIVAGSSTTGTEQSALDFFPIVIAITGVLGVLGVIVFAAVQMAKK